MITLIAAIDQNNLIGNKNQIPWKLPEDLKFFKQVTTGKNVVMGRKTYESIGKPLPNRNNYIITNDHSYKTHSAYVIHSIETILFLSQIKKQEFYIIGGSQIYKLFLPHADYMILTHIHSTYQGDTYFPRYEEKEWEKYFNYDAISKSGIPYSIAKYRKNFDQGEIYDNLSL
jgi:dihydrofolate reductase